MSKHQKKNKIGINFYSTGTFLNLNKPKFLSIDKSKSYKTKNINSNDINHNISEDISNLETYTKLTENTSKDEIIKVLKERLTILENKVKILEKENKEKTEKINSLNLSQGTQNNEKKKFGLSEPKVKLNLKLIKNNKNIFKNLSRNLQKEKSKTIINNSSFNSFMNLNNNNNKSNYINSNKNIKNNFFNIFNVNNNNNSKIKISNTALKKMGKKFILISKKNLFADATKKTLNKASSIDSNNFKNNKLKNDFNKNIPKIPKKKKLLGTDIINNSSNKYHIKISIPPEENNFRFKRSNSEKKTSLRIINNNYSNEKDNINNLNNKHFKNKNNSNFEDIKRKLENIKNRTKTLLEYYSSNNNNNKI